MPSPNLRIATIYADVVELVDTHALGACASRREGSSPFIRTKTKNRAMCSIFYLVSIYNEARTHFQEKA